MNFFDALAQVAREIQEERRDRQFEEQRRDRLVLDFIRQRPGPWVEDQPN